MRADEGGAHAERERGKMYHLTVEQFDAALELAGNHCCPPDGSRFPW